MHLDIRLMQKNIHPQEQLTLTRNVCKCLHAKNEIQQQNNMLSNI